MKHSIMIDGGAGRVISSIPALEAFVKKHAEDEIRIFVHGWESIFWSNKLLQPYVYSINQKGNWEYIKNSKRWMPEPYHCQEYIDGDAHLIDCFAKELEVELSDNKVPRLYTSKAEKAFVRSKLDEIRAVTNKQKIVVVQPYGSTMTNLHGTVCDTSERSLNPNHYLMLGKELSKHSTVVFFGVQNLEHPKDDFAARFSSLNPDHRFWIALIEQCDYFIGVDSMGQHIARAFDKPGIVIMGSTRETNVSYAEHFKIIRREGYTPEYVPIRFAMYDTELTARLNDGIMNFTDKEIQDIILKISADAQAVEISEKIINEERVNHDHCCSSQRA